VEAIHTLFAKLDLDEEGSISFSELESLFVILAAMEKEFTMETILGFYEEVCVCVGGACCCCASCFLFV